MFNASFIANLEAINTSKSKREAISGFLYAEKDAVYKMLLFAEENKALAAKSLRAVEIVAREKPEMLHFYMDLLLKLAKKAKTDAEIRPMAKIFESMMADFFKNEKSCFTKQQLESVTQINFDWFLSNQKTAIKAYSMNTLFMLGKDFPWIRPELQALLLQNISTGTAGYKARARMILKKMR